MEGAVVAVLSNSCLPDYLLLPYNVESLVRVPGYHSGHCVSDEGVNVEVAGRVVLDVDLPIFLVEFVVGAPHLREGCGDVF